MDHTQCAYTLLGHGGFQVIYCSLKEWDLQKYSALTSCFVLGFVFLTDVNGVAALISVGAELGECKLLFFSILLENAPIKHILIEGPSLNMESL